MSDHQEATIIYGYDLGMHDSLNEDIETIWSEIAQLNLSNPLVDLDIYGTWTDQEGYVVGVKSSRVQTGYCDSFQIDANSVSIDGLAALTEAKTKYVEAGFLKADAEPSWLLLAYYG